MGKIVIHFFQVPLLISFLIEIERTFARGIVGSEGYLVLKGIERSED
jgi:hypothetical protein